MDGLPDSQINGTTKKQKGHGKLLCCFDGTGNEYSGDTSDTNIVKLYQKFDRKAPRQFHYYQRKFCMPRGLSRTDMVQLELEPMWLETSLSISDFGEA